MNFTLPYWVYSIFIFILPVFASGQEQVTQIEGPDCCYHVVEINEMEDRLFVLATDYRGAARLYEKINGNYILYMENIPQGQREVAHQGFGVDGNYFFVLYQKEVHYYYPLTNEWESYKLPEHGVYSRLPDWYSCHSTLRVSEHGVIDWKRNERPNIEVDLIFYDIQKDEEVSLFEGKFFNDHCPEIYQIDEYIVGFTRSDSGGFQVISHHIPTHDEKVLLESDGLIEIQKANDKFILIAGLECYITTGNPDSTFQLAHTVDDASFATIQHLNDRWEIIFSFDNREIYTRQYSLQGDFIEDEWINYSPPLLSDPFRVVSIERTAYDKYILTFMFNSIYVLDLVTQDLTPIENTETFYSPKKYFSIGPYLITYDGKNYYDKKIQSFHLSNSEYKTYKTPDVAQMNKMKLIGDKIYLIANNIKGDLLIPDEIINYMGTLFSFQIDEEWKQELQLPESSYGLLYGRLEETDNDHYLIGSGQIFKFNNGDFEKVYEAGQILDWMSTENGQYFISTDTAYQQDVTKIELYHISENGNLQLLGEFNEPSKSFSRYGLKLIPSGVDSHQILVDFSFGSVFDKISYFDLTNQKVVDLNTPNSGQTLEFLDVENNMVIGNAGNSYWKYDPKNKEYTHLFDVPHNGSVHDGLYQSSLQNYYLNFYFEADTIFLYSTNKSSLNTEKILQVNGLYGGSSLIKILAKCNQSTVFSIGHEEPTVFVTDGTPNGTHQIVQWSDIVKIFPASENLPYVNVQSESSGLYYWNCSIDTFEKANDSLISIQYPFTLKGQNWVVGKDSKGLTAKINNNHSIQVHEELQTDIGHDRNATRLYTIYSDDFAKQVSSNQAVFRANFNGDGPELWTFISDSTLTQVADLNPGPFGSFPYDFTLIEDYLYFIAYTYDDGMQVWRLHKDLIGTTSSPTPYQNIEFAAAPNPTQSHIQLTDLPIESSDILLMDPSGRTLQHIQKPPGTNKYTLPLDSYTPGLYFIKVREKGGNSGAIKIIKL